MCFSLICCGWMLLTLVCDVGYAAMNRTTTLFVDHGQSAKISCNYLRANDTEIMSAAMQTLNQTLCSYIFQNNSWTKQKCRDHIKFNWIPDTWEMSFELLNLQIQSTNTYTCTVKKLSPPPQFNLGIIQNQVIVNPVLSVSCVKRPDGSPMIQCSVGFYYALELLWIRDGDVLGGSYSNKSFNRYFKHESYHILPPQNNGTVYSCWANHSSLNKPLMANISSSVCYEKEGVTLPVTMVFAVFFVLSVFLIIAVVICKCYRRACQQSASSVTVSVTYKPVLLDVLQSDDLYSTLGNHHPVPMSLIRG